MRFQFDGNQAYQLRAIEAVADLLRGQARLTPNFAALELGQMFSPVANRIDLDAGQLLANLHAVQKRHVRPRGPTRPNCSASKSNGPSRRTS